MSRVLFANTYFYRLDAKQWRSRQPYPPLGTIQAAAVVRDAGFTTALFDASLRESPVEIGDVLQMENPEYLVIYDDGFNYLTKMCLTAMRAAAFTMIQMGKSSGCKVIVTSSDAADHFKKYLSVGSDFVIRGEGEETLLELLQELENGRDKPAVNGIAFLRNQTPEVTSPRPVMRNIDALPMPAWDLIDIAAYERIWRRAHGYFSLNVATTRGCPFKCNWCAKPIYGNRYNSRSPQQVVNEIEMLLMRYHPDHIWMCDDIFGLKPGWVNAFRNEVRDRRLTFRYKIQSRADLLLADDTIEALVHSGLETVWIGAESGSQHVLDDMEKGITVEQVREATSRVRQHGAKVAFFLQFGYPGETKEDVSKTIDLVLDLMPDEIGISVSYPLPGTKFYERVIQKMSQKRNWHDSDELAMMFTNTYPAQYYRVLHRYVHNRYRINRGMKHLRQVIKKGITVPGLRNVASMLYNLPQSLIRARRLEKLSRYALN